MSPAEVSEKLERDGFALVREALDSSAIDQLIKCVSDPHTDHLQRGGDTYGARNLLRLALISQTARSPSLCNLLAPALRGEFIAVRAIYFDKTPRANWPVTWHQDLSLAVTERRELAGWTNWTVKRGIPHVQAPASVLERMITVRIHLDDCAADNGALRVIAGSHRHGVLAREQIALFTQPIPAVVITAMTGDVLLMKPLLLHASSPARNPTHRRVLHLEFASRNLLPDGLSWAAVA